MRVDIILFGGLVASIILMVAAVLQTSILIWTHQDPHT